MPNYLIEELILELMRNCAEEVKGKSIEESKEIIETYAIFIKKYRDMISYEGMISLSEYGQKLATYGEFEVSTFKQ